mgnify:FL=1|nr:bifunctional adenosylcobinamide kinase/adenosylcobinamide-phosphate guanylyltransferase [uncultured Mediterraneibacter sp.]
MLELVTGGSGSGKSAYAESRICEWNRQGPNPLFYIATMYPYGEETEKKIERHRILRKGKGFETLEWYTGLKQHLEDGSLKGADVLLECMSNLVANEMYMESGAGCYADQAILEGIRELNQQCSNLVIVTNEVFSESVPDSPEMKEYKRILGKINREIATMADQVTEVIYGIAKQTGETVMCQKENRFHIIMGGAFQGKTQYATKIYPGLELTDGFNCPLDEIENCVAVNKFHSFTRRWLLEERTKEALLTMLENNRNLQLLISDEIGYGLVPIDDFEREYREFHGRVMTELAEKADCVERVVCGIPQRIK